MVLVARLDPPWAVGTGLLLPEGGAALQVVHEEITGLEGGAAVRGGGGDKDDGLARGDVADPVEDEQVLQGEACAGLVGDGLVVVEPASARARPVKLAMAPVSVRPWEKPVSRLPGSKGWSVSRIISRRSSGAGRRPRRGR